MASSKIEDYKGFNDIFNHIYKKVKSRNFDDGKDSLYAEVESIYMAIEMSTPFMLKDKSGDEVRNKFLEYKQKYNEMIQIMEVALKEGVD